jgi:hypothetical protein
MLKYPPSFIARISISTLDAGIWDLANYIVLQYQRKKCARIRSLGCLARRRRNNPKGMNSENTHGNYPFAPIISRIWGKRKHHRRHKPSSHPPNNSLLHKLKYNRKEKKASNFHTPDILPNPAFHQFTP